MGEPVAVTRLFADQVLRCALTDPPRNILDRRALASLTSLLAAAHEPHLKAILLCGEGPNFSLGASVAEHTRAEAPTMLAAFEAAIRTLLAPNLPVVVAIRGHCLGGGLELAMFGTHVVAHIDARLGQPEIRLGALAPVASVALRHRLGQARAEDLILSGRVVDAAWALRLGLCDETTSDDPEAAAVAWIEASLLPHSASSLRLSCRATRMALMSDLDTFLPRLLRLYRDELLPTHDAEEGVRAFLEKRQPRWEGR